jgi:antitoxin ParD1/3/4
VTFRSGAGAQDANVFIPLDVAYRHSTQGHQLAPRLKQSLPKGNMTRGMTAKFTVKVSLTQYLADFIGAQVASGQFATASEIVRAGLRLLEQDQNDKAAAPGKQPLRPGPEQ